MMRFKTWRTWTRKEELRMEAMRLEGATAAAIAAALGRSLSSVKNRLQALALPRSSCLVRYLPVLVEPHTMRSATAALGVKKRAILKAKRALAALGFAVWYCQRKRPERNSAPPCPEAS